MRFFQRADGTVLTADCPIGLRSVRRRLARAVAGMAALIALMTSGALFARGGGPARIEEAPLDEILLLRGEPVGPRRGPISRFARWLDPPPEPVYVVLGDVCLPGE